MTVQACLLFLACAFYLAYFAQSTTGRASLVAWSISLALAVFPICGLIYEYVRWFFR